MLATEGGINVLINYPGMLPEATANASEAVDLALFVETFETNVFGVVSILDAFLPLVRTSPAGGIVNLTTRMGSLTDQQDPAPPYHSMVVPTCQASKAAVNNITIASSKALKVTPIKVSSVCLGFVQTDLTPMNSTTPTSAAEAAEVVANAATLPADAESGTFIDASRNVLW